MTDEEFQALLDWLEHGSLKGASMPTWEQLRVAMAQLLRERNDVRSSFANTIHHYRCENKPGCTRCACERDALRAKLAEAREVVKWYSGLRVPDYVHETADSYATGKVMYDGGQRARDFLARLDASAECDKAHDHHDEHHRIEAALRAKLAEARELLLGILRHEEQYVEHACHAVRATVRVALARIDSDAADKTSGASAGASAGRRPDHQTDADPSGAGGPADKTGGG